MPQNYGKAFEQQFKSDIERLGWFIYRLPDQVTGYAITSRNPCDYFVYKKPKLHMIECKSIHGNTFTLSALRQYELMLSYADVEGVYPAVIIWFIDHDSVLYVPVKQIQELKQDNKKSIHIKDKDKYLIVPSVKKRIFMTSDYSFLESI